MWICDGVGWGWDTRFKIISRLLPKYKHISTSRGSSPQCMIDRIENCNPDVLIVMSPVLLFYLKKYANRIITTLTSFGALGTSEHLYANNIT